ncbi:hypothetical protein [Variovorax saccharolyticus]|uniref:hypothetical protein n=1 Tax=Variovorax saccharolyticus TaxID=3053516 RepID=UPI00257822C1|nr:hypothetical protein [Variovorax sp. J31P216]MDM0024067.1 hypothetical protein [Variovorax sp. J31P216]
MKTYARMIDGQVAQVITSAPDADGFVAPLDHRFPPEVLEQLVEFDPLKRPIPPLSLEERIAALLAAVDLHLNQAARAKGYDGIVTAALRAGYPGPFHDEGVAFATWMDSVYATCYQLLAQWQAGELEEPTASELIAMLPALELPS